MCPPQEDSTYDEEREPSRSGDSILDSIARRAGRAPRVHLRDAGTGDGPPLLDPKARAVQEELRGADREKYRVLGEIARGGMGAVLRGHDLELGREVAMKVVHAELADRPEVVARFVEEAQIGGQLQHPGIVPVYELGLMADQRPYFTMKLVKGRTLAAMLSRRKSPEEDRLRYLSIFASVCQTMAYAHSKGVIHRDLKPANIMVGAFGEVQVVDWGLSKVIGRGGVADELASQDSARTIIETVRSGPSSGSDSVVGNVLGTPAYMSPEQAQGVLDELDERTDVFALGAILCELLTGAPPYVAGEGENLVRMAAKAELSDARARLEAASAPAELKALCLDALAPARQARLSSAEELAQAVHAHLTGLESAAHEAQLAAADERLRAERSRRRLQLTLVVAALLAAAGGGWWWTGVQRRERALELEHRLAGVQEEVRAEERDGHYETALEAARVGERMLEAAGADAELLARAGTLVETTETAFRADQERRAARAREARLLAFLTDLEMRQEGAGIGETLGDIEAEYVAALEEYGLDLAGDELGARLVELRDTELGVQLALSFDRWARVLRRMGKGDTYQAELLTGIGLDVDTDPVRTSVREALIADDRERLVAMAREEDAEALEPDSLYLLASGLRELGEAALSRRLMTTGADRHPAHFSLVHGAAVAHADSQDWLRAEAYLRAAVALRPDLPLLLQRLAEAQRRSGDYARAIRSLELARELAPEYRWNRFDLARDLFAMGRFEEAVGWYEEALADNAQDLMAESFLLGCLGATGRMELEELVEWSASLETENPGWWIWPAILLGYVPPEGRELDPARALELTDPFVEAQVPSEYFWIARAAAFANLGDGAATIEAARRAAAVRPAGERHSLAEMLLLEAVGHRLAGDPRAARTLLERALELRDQLVAGREEEWQRGFLARAFERYLPMAR